MSAELEHGSFSWKDQQSRLTYGVVLTAGAQVKKSPFWLEEKKVTDQSGTVMMGKRIEPDPEGKMRVLAALHDLLNGRIDRILLAGGSRVEDNSSDESVYVPLAHIYARYLKRLTKVHNLNPRRVQIVNGGVNTSTDLKKTKALLKKRRLPNDVRVYSTSYQLRRRAVRRFLQDKDLDVHLERAELKIIERHKRPGIVKIIDRILTKEHLDEMRKISFASEFLPPFVWDPTVYILRDERVVKLGKRVRRLVGKI